MEAVTAGELDQHYCPPIRQPSRWLLNAPPIIEPCIRSIANRCLPNHISAVAVIQCCLHGGQVYFRRFCSKVFPDFFFTYIADKLSNRNHSANATLHRFYHIQDSKPVILLPIVVCLNFFFGQKCSISSILGQIIGGSYSQLPFRVLNNLLL